MAASAGVSETSSLPSLRPRVTSSSGRDDQGRFATAASGATRSFAGRFSRARYSATAAGTAARSAICVTVQAASFAIATNSSTRAPGASCPRAGIGPRGGSARRDSMSAC
jgi:hypothetical protein